MKKYSAFVMCILMIVDSRQVTAETQYTITDLGTLGGSISYAYGINNKGHVVGQYFKGGQYRAFFYDGTC